MDVICRIPLLKSLDNRISNLLKKSIKENYDGRGSENYYYHRGEVYEFPFGVVPDFVKEIQKRNLEIDTAFRANLSTQQNYERNLRAKRNAEACNLGDPIIPELWYEAQIPSILNALGVEACVTEDRKILDSKCQSEAVGTAPGCESAADSTSAALSYIGVSAAGSVAACGNLAVGGGGCAEAANILGAISGCTSFAGGACGGGAGGLAVAGGLGPSVANSDSETGCEKGENPSGCSAKTFQDQSNFSVGCSDLQVVSQKTFQANKSIQCIIKNKQSETNSTINASQDLTIHAPFLKCNGPLTISQTMEIKSILSSTFTSEDYEQIKDKTVAAVDAGLDAMTSIVDEKNGFTPSDVSKAHQQIVDAQTALTTESLQQSITSNLQTTIGRIYASQSQTIYLDNATINGACTFNQDMYIDSVVSAVFQSISQTIQENEKFIDLTATIKAKQEIKTDNTSVFKNLIWGGIIIAALLIFSGIAFAAFKYFTKKDKKVLDTPSQPLYNEPVLDTPSPSLPLYNEPVLDIQDQVLSFLTGK